MSATLTSLRIRNLALVEEVTWETAPGFVAITGETGTGKSILLGALTLVLGDRADRHLIRTGADNCSVEALFEDTTDRRIGELLSSHGADPCEDGRLIIKRVISSEGSGKQFVNGSPCTLTLLRSLGNLLIDLHGPHDHQSLFSREQQTYLLDDFAGAAKLRDDFAQARSLLLRL
ncbi:MAG TPA: AAA family ATPase, partial [Terrimicrobiaceae bacterium]